MIEIIDLINILSSLPGIGKKSASRLAYYLLKNQNTSKNLISILDSILNNIHNCNICGAWTTHTTCEVCSNPQRIHSFLCIVEEQRDMQAIEETGIYKGIYHILGGAINPLEGIGPEKLKIHELQERLISKKFDDILIATNPTIEGEATFLYIENIIKNLTPTTKISRIATGIPMGGSLEYSDKYTLSKAILLKQYLN